MTIPPNPIIASSAWLRNPVPVAAAAALVLLPLVVVDADELVDVGVCDVVDFGAFEVVGGGGGGVVGFGGGGGGGGGGGLAPTKSHSPYKIPTLVGAKNSKSPCVRSSPPYGHPGHCRSYKRNLKCSRKINCTPRQ
jgi:hypothetical protein